MLTHKHCAFIMPFLHRDIMSGGILCEWHFLRWHSS